MVRERGPATARDSSETGVERARFLVDPLVRGAAWAGAAWLVMFAVATAVVGGSARGRLILGNVVYQVPVLVVAVLTVLAARKAEGPRRGFWRALAVANLCWLGGELCWSYFELIANQEPTPSVADAFYLSSSAIAIIAIIRGFGGRALVRMGRSLLDASVLVAFIGLLFYRLFVAPQLSEGITLEAAIGVAYPMLDVIILGMLGTLALSGFRQVPRSVVLVSCAFFAAAVSDGAYTYLVLRGDYGSGGWLDLGWQIQAVLMGVAALIVVRRENADERPMLFGRDLGLPLILGGAAISVFYVMQTALRHRIDPATVAVGSYAVVAVIARLGLTSREKSRIGRDLEHALEEQQRLAVTDGLTSLNNRRFFEEMFRIEAARAERSSQSLGVLVVDVDHFKDVNDAYGHEAGDAVLVQLAARLRGVVRASDVLARYGGEEFVVLLPESRPKVLRVIAERLRAAVADLPFALPGGERIIVTVSVGGACQPEHAEGADIVRSADRALYAAKNRGRNCVQIGPSREPDPLTIAS